MLHDNAPYKFNIDTDILTLDFGGNPDHNPDPRIFWRINMAHYIKSVLFARCQHVSAEDCDDPAFIII